MTILGVFEFLDGLPIQISRVFLKKSPMLSPEQIQKIFKAKNLRILKNLGQNFLIDEKVLGAIVKSADIGKGDIVLEIGPGLGVLTKEISKKCGKVIAIEKDRKLAEFLEELKNKKLLGDNVEIINGDILKLNIEEIIKKHGASGDYKLVSNIPYYITSPVIKLFLENKIQPKLIILLIQKEVAERICATAGKMSILALSVQIYGQPEIVDFVSRVSFYPQPEVNSAILKIKNIKKNFSDDCYKKVFKMIKIGFSSKRKKLVNNFSAGLDVEKNQAGEMLKKAGINPNLRAQELNLEDWERLSEK